MEIHPEMSETAKELTKTVNMHMNYIDERAGAAMKQHHESMADLKRETAKFTSYFLTQFKNAEAAQDPSYPDICRAEQVKLCFYFDSQK